jgi:hypothetical protein
MNTNAATPPPPKRRLGRIFLWTGISLAILLAIAAALFYPVENWRGRRAWENCRRELTARGERLDWASYIPEVVASRSNIYEAPKMSEWFVGRGTNELGRLLDVQGFYNFSRRSAASNFISLVDLTISDDTNLDHRRFDVVAQLLSNGRYILQRRITPSTNAVNNATVIPLIVMEEVPLVDAVKNLAVQAGRRYVFDADSRVSTGPSTPELPPVTVSWADITALQALEDLLDHYGLRWVEDPASGIAHIKAKQPFSPPREFPTPAAQMEELMQKNLGRSLQTPSGLTLVATRDQIRPLRVLFPSLPWTALELEEEQPFNGQTLASTGTRSRQINFEYVQALLVPNGLGTFGFDLRHLKGQTNGGPGRFQMGVISPQICSATEFLAWSDKFKPQFDLIREGLKRSEARRDGNYRRPHEMPVPNIASIRFLTFTLSQRAQSYLLLGDPDNALRELTLLHKTRGLLEAKPVMLVSAMVEVATTGIYAKTVADGLKLHAWREPDLKVLQQQLAEIDSLPPLADALRAERAAAIGIIEVAMADRRNNKEGASGKRAGGRLPEIKFFGMPGGWLLQNYARVSTLFQKSIDCLDLTNRVVRAAEVEAWERKVEQYAAGFSPYSWLAVIAIPNFARAFQRSAHNQTLVEQTMIACALERYRLAQGQLPDSLAQLVPQWLGKLPRDVISGEPLHYRRPDGGQFVLYSVGWDGKDEGGITQAKTAMSARPVGDWVWPAVWE